MTPRPTDPARMERWFHRYHPHATTGRHLIVFPHAGGAAHSYRRLSGLLSPRLDVSVVQYPGRAERAGEPFVDDVPLMARLVVDAWERGPAPREVALLGHSLGALVAYEATVLLEERGFRPRALFVSAQGAPSRRSSRPEYHLLGDDALVAVLRELDGTDEEALAVPEFVQMWMPVVRADYRALAAYEDQPGRHVRCPIEVMRGDADVLVDDESAAAWADHTSDAADIHTFAGGHFYLTEDVAAAAYVLDHMAPDQDLTSD